MKNDDNKHGETGPENLFLGLACYPFDKFTKTFHHWGRFGRGCKSLVVALIQVYINVCSVLYCFMYSLPDCFHLYLTEQDNRCTLILSWLGDLFNMVSTILSISFVHF